MTEFMFSIIIKSTVILLTAGLVDWMLRRQSAATRHLVWTAALAGLLALPLLPAVFPSWGPRCSQRSADVSSTKSPNTAAGPLWLAMRAPGESVADEVESARLAPPEAAPVDRRFARPDATLVLAVLWAGGTAIGALFLLAGIARLWRLHRGAAEAGPGLERALNAVRAQLGVWQPVRLLIAERPIVPLTWGCRRPVVLLPPAARDWSAKRLRQVLAHELAHVERYDFLTQLVGQLARQLYWFHPLAWWAWRRQRIEQEQACDDRVLAIGHAPHEYAEQLLTVTAGLPETFVQSSVALAMGRVDRIERRLAAILDVSRVRGAAGRRRLIAAVTAAVLFTVSVATFAPNRSQSAETGLGISSPLPGSPDENRGSPAANSATDAGDVATPAEKDESAREGTNERSAPSASSLLAIEKILAKNYSKTDQAKLTEAAIKGMLQSLDDPYAQYFTAQESAELKQMVEGRITGIGAELKSEEGRIVMPNVFPGSPAERAGLRRGDEVLEIDRHPVPKELSDVVHKLRGAAGTVVHVKGRRKDGTEFQCEITRGPIQIPEVLGLWRAAGGTSQHWIDPDKKLAYLQITTFNPATVSQTRKLIEKLQQEGLKGLVIDLRDSPGGLLAAAIERKESC
jgi:C-terminal processing protease CtpA/Prc/beta-lactamase regulating signal transducer with metallopeptidase domain